MSTPEQRNDELRRILWALQDNAKALDVLLDHGRKNVIEPVRYASLAMAKDGLSNAISFTRQAIEQPETSQSGRVS